VTRHFDRERETLTERGLGRFGSKR
jgi:hypothetical protein